MQALANKTIVSLYGRPAEGQTLIDEVLYGMPVEILKMFEEDGEETHDLSDAFWCYVRAHYRYEGYCRKKDLYFGSKMEQFTGENMRVVMQSYADVLSEPKVQGACMQSVTRGGRLRLIGAVSDREGWMEVALVDGKVGYTKEKFLGPLYVEPFTEDENVFRQRVVDMAKLYMGTQYRWGGKSTLGIDCSGLTSMSYMLCGVIIYRDADIVEGFPVHEIPFSAKKPGDLLYFPGHIAMYMGEDLYIHSTGKNGSDGVVINSFDPKHPLYRADLVEMLKCVGTIF